MVYLKAAKKLQLFLTKKLVWRVDCRSRVTEGPRHRQTPLLVKWYFTTSSSGLGWCEQKRTCWSGYSLVSCFGLRSLRVHDSRWGRGRIGILCPSHQ